MDANVISQPALVSVILPTYNRPEYLKQALASVVQQTYRNVEIIVSDNCSPENPQALVESFQDTRIRFHRNETNIEGFPNLVQTFKMSQGKYVASLMDDDIWEEDFLAKLVPALEANPDLAIAFCDHYIIDENGNIDYPEKEKCSHFYGRNFLKAGIYQNYYQLAIVKQAISPAIAAVIRRDAIDWDRIPLEVGSVGDLYLAYLCCRSGGGAYYVAERLTRYRVHGQTETMLSGDRNAQAKIRKAQSQIFCYKLFLEDEKIQEFQPYFQRKLFDSYTTLGIGLMRTGQIKEARAYFWRALKAQKFNLRTVAALMLSFTPASFASRF